MSRRCFRIFSIFGNSFHCKCNRRLLNIPNAMFVVKSRLCFYGVLVCLIIGAIVIATSCNLSYSTLFPEDTSDYRELPYYSSRAARLNHRPNKNYTSLASHNARIGNRLQQAAGLGTPDTTVLVRIPKVIHQIWTSNLIPPGLVPIVQSWKNINQNFTYWFWTIHDVRALISVAYSEPHIELFDSYPNDEQRLEASRYYVLDSFGGFVADLNVECRKPLNDMTSAHHCILAREDTITSVLLWKRTLTLSTSVMACVAKHALLDKVVKTLPQITITTMKHDTRKLCGAEMLQTVLTHFDKNGFSNKSGVYIADSNVFYQSPDPALRDYFRAQCSDPIVRNWITARSVCDLYKTSEKFNPQTPDAYTIRRWNITAKLNGGLYDSKFVDVRDSVPELILAKHIMSLRKKLS